MGKRYILHSDLNNFYASVESLYNPSIRNKAVVVVGDQEKRHGIVLAKNYVAKAYDVKTGDTVWEARQKCKQELVCVTARFDLYLYISRLVKQIYREYSDKVESFGIDEAWIDISHLASSYAQAIQIADNIRCRIVTELGLTVSIGVSYNKIFAKLASDLKKPNATIVIREEDYQSLVWRLPASELLYVGRATTKKLERGNIKTIGDLAKADRKFLKLTLGKMGEHLWKFANGLDDSPVTSFNDKEVVKSFGNSTTCPIDLYTFDQVKSVIYTLAESVAERIKYAKMYCKEVSLWVKDTNLDSFDRQMQLERLTNLSDDIALGCIQLFKDNYGWHRGVRAIGVRASALSDHRPPTLLDKEKNFKKENLETVVENLKKRYGNTIIRRGNILAYAELSPIDPYSESHIIHPVGFFKAKV